MPRTVDLFLDSDQPLERVADQLREVAGLRLSASPGGGSFAARDGEVLVRLSEHNFVDDDGLPLSEFRFVLSATVKPTVDVDASEELRCLRTVNAALRDAGDLASLLVIDLERPAPPGFDVS